MQRSPFSKCWMPILLVACGGGGEPLFTDSDTPIAGSCVNGGNVTGCLVLDSDSCNGDIALNSAKGGHFYIEGGHLIVNIAANNDNVDMVLEIVDTMGLTNGVTYTVPDQTLVTLTDNTDTRDPIVYYGCEGSVTITNYVEGESLHGELDFAAATTAGSCHVSEWYTAQGEFSSLSFCAAKDG